MENIRVTTKFSFGKTGVKMNSRDAFTYILREIETYKKDMTNFLEKSDTTLFKQMQLVLEDDERAAMIEDLNYLQQMLALIALARHQLFFMDAEGNILQDVLEDEDDDYKLENCEVA